MAKSKTRRAPSRLYDARNGAITLTVLAVLLILVTMFSQGKFSSNPVVTVRLDNIGAALNVGSDVKMQGVIVGTVSSIDARPGGTTLKLKLDPTDIHGIPDNVVASVLPSSVFGTAAVDLNVHGTPSLQKLAGGDVIQQDKAQPTLELQAALDDVDSLVKALGPADLNNALSSMAQAVGGRGHQLAATIQIADTLVRRATASMPLIRSDLGLLATNLNIVDRDAPLILQGVAQGLPVAKTIVELAGPFARTLADAQVLLRTLSTFFGAHAPALTQAIQQGAAVIQVTYTNRIAGILHSFEENTVFAIHAPQSVHDGRVLIVGGAATDVRPYYTKADCPTYGSLRGPC